MSTASIRPTSDTLAEQSISYSSIACVFHVSVSLRRMKSITAGLESVFEGGIVLVKG